MNKSYKAVSTIAGICLGIGVLILIIFSATGGWNVVKGTWNNSSSSLSSEDISKDFDGDIHSLNLDFSYGNITIESGDKFSLQADNVVEGSLKVIEVKNGVLTIRQELGQSWSVFGFNFNVNPGTNYNFQSHITLTVPEDFEAEDFELSTGAGNVKIQGFHAQKAKFDLGAGNTNVNEFSAEKISVSTGAGNLEMSDVQLNDLDIDSGVGNTTVDGIVTGDCDFDCGVGNMTLNLTGDIDDYNFDIDRGVGKVRINGESWERKHTDGAENNFNINSGVGSVDVNIDPE